MLYMSRARINILGVGYQEQLQQLNEPTEHEINHILEALPEVDGPDHESYRRSQRRESDTACGYRTYFDSAE